MGIQRFVSGESLKKLLDEKSIHASSIKLALQCKGILPVYVSPSDLSELTFRLILGSAFMTEIHQVIKCEENYLKSTVVTIKPESRSSADSFLVDLSDSFTALQSISNTRYCIKSVRRVENALYLRYSYTKQLKGKVELVGTKEISLDIEIKPMADGRYKINIRHEGATESKPFVALLEEMVNKEEDKPLFSVKRITLDHLTNANKVDFFEQFGSYDHQSWSLIDVTNVTVNKSVRSIDEDDDDIEQELDENEPTGRLTGISSAILSGGGLRNNDFVKECMLQGFIFSSMRYKFRHRTLPITIEIEVTFKQEDLKINIYRSYRTEEDGRDYRTPLSHRDQDDFIDYFQIVAYDIYSTLLSKQKSDVSATKKAD